MLDSLIPYDDDEAEKLFYEILPKDLRCDKKSDSDIIQNTYCGDCKVDISYVKDMDRYVTCPKCKQDIYVGKEKLFKKGKFKHAINS